MKNETKFLFAGLLVALVIAALAPFIASSNPDGLESAFFGIYGAKEIHGEELNEEAAAAAEEAVMEKTGNTFSFGGLMPDYTIPGLEKEGEVIAILVGTLAVLLIGIGISRALAQPK